MSKEELNAKRRRRYQIDPAKHRESDRAYRVAHPEAVKSTKLRIYGITLVEYNALFEKQHGLCAICGEAETIWDKRTGTLRALAVDHNHECCPGKRSCGLCIRGLLCSSCNQGLGRFKDSVERLRSALEYLS